MKTNIGSRQSAVVMALVGAALVAAPAVAQTPGSLWTSLGDPVLTQLIGEALAGNRDVRAMEARVRAARAVRNSAALDLAPTVTAIGGYTRIGMSSASTPGFTAPDQGTWDAGAQLAWDLDVFGRTRRQLQGHNAFVSAAQEDVREAQVLLAASIAASYFELHGIQERLLTARRNAENQRQTLALTQRRLEAGRGNAFDTERARALLSSTLAELPLLEAALETAQYRIAVLVGRAPSALVPLAGDAPINIVLPEDVSLAAADSAIRRRPDVRSAERQVAAREALSGAATSDYLPRISIAGSAGYTALSAGSFGSNGTSRYAVGPVVSWPLLNLGRVKAGVDAARGAESEARSRYEQAVLRAHEEVESGAARYRGARSRLQHLDDAAAASERAAELARLRYQEGASDFLQVLDAERTLLEAQDRRARGRMDARLALVEVYRSLGG